MLTIRKSDLGTKYFFIGYGDEGMIYKYNDEIAIKIYTKHVHEVSKYKRKLLKIKQMITELQKDPNCSFPMGFVSYNGIDIVGIYLPYVKKHKYLDDLEDLPMMHNKEKEKQIIIKADQVLQRLHEQQIIVGDVKSDNILISPEEEPIYIDCDNYQYKNHLFDLIPDRAGCLYYTYQTPSMCLQDNDKLLFAIMVLNILTHDERFNYCSSKEQLSAAIKQLRVEKEVLKELEYIFSPKLDKPYLGPILEKVNINRM